MSSSSEGGVVERMRPIDAIPGEPLDWPRTGRLEACAGTFGHEVPVSISSSPGPCPGHIIGLRRSVREWALRQGLEQAAGAPGAGAGNLGGCAGDAGGALRVREGSLRR
jgi:hypothetical protein